jgi:predicted esterase
VFSIQIEIQINPKYKRSTIEFQDVQKEVFNCYFSQNFNEGLKIASNARNLYPESISKTTFWIACFYALLGDNEKALEALEEGIKHGAWWPRNLLLSEQDIKELRKHPRLLNIAEFGDKRFNKEKTKSQPKLLVRTPKSYNENKKYPLLFVLHWRGGNNTEFEVYWNKVIERNEILLCLLQSSQMSGDSQFCWDDEKKGLLELQKAFFYLKKKFNIDLSKIILAGASQGARLSFTALLSDLIPTSGFIYAFPSIGDSNAFINNFKDVKSLQSLRGSIIAGQRDSFYKENKLLCEILINSGVECKFFSYPDLGHLFPDDFDLILKKSIDYILKMNCNDKKV